MNQEVWWVQSLMTVLVIAFYKVQECTCSTPEDIILDCLAFELSKLRFQGHNLLNEFLK